MRRCKSEELPKIIRQSNPTKTEIERRKDLIQCLNIKELATSLYSFVKVEVNPKIPVTDTFVYSMMGFLEKIILVQDKFISKISNNIMTHDDNEQQVHHILHLEKNI